MNRLGYAAGSNPLNKLDARGMERDTLNLLGRPVQSMTKSNAGAPFFARPPPLDIARS